MKAVNRYEFLWLISKGHIKQERGKLLDIVVSNGKSKKKTRWVTDDVYEKLKLMVDMTGLK